MKQPKEVRPEHVLCFVCKKPIHLDEWAGVCKEGYFHSNAFCLMEVAKIVKERETQTLDSIAKNHCQQPSLKQIEGEGSKSEDGLHESEKGSSADTCSSATEESQ